MTNHPNRTKFRYFSVCPRGFANEVIYLRVPSEKASEVDSYFDGWADRQFDNGNTGASCGWTTARVAKLPGVAVDWEDRAYAGLI